MEQPVALELSKLKQRADAIEAHLGLTDPTLPVAENPEGESTQPVAKAKGKKK